MEEYNDFHKHVGKPRMNLRAPFRVSEDGRFRITRQDDGLYPPQEPDPKYVRRIRKSWPSAVPVFNRSWGYWQIYDSDPRYNGNANEIATLKDPETYAYIPLDQRIVVLLAKAWKRCQDCTDPEAYEDQREAEDRAFRAKQEADLDEKRRWEIQDRITKKMRSNFAQGIVSDYQEGSGHDHNPTPKLISIPAKGD